MKKTYTKTELLKVLRYELNREQLNEIVSKIEDKEYIFTKTSDMGTFKQLFVNIKDSYRDNKGVISLFRTCYNLLNSSYMKSGFINRYEIDGVEDDLSLVYREAEIEGTKQKHMFIGTDSIRKYNNVTIENHIVLYVPGQW